MIKITPDRRISEILQEQPFTFSAELVPPRNGDSMESVFLKVDALNQGPVDFLSITKGAGGSLRGGTIPIAYLIKHEYGIPVIAHFTCMDQTIHEIENSFVDHSYLGISNILALRGDPPTGVFTKYCATDNQHQYAYQLIEQIVRLREGKYILRKGYDQGEAEYHQGEPLNFCIGAAAYPEPLDHSVDESVNRFIMKIDCGAAYGITQMTYSPEAYQIFLEKLREQDKEIPILPGIRVIKSINQANFLEKTFKISIPQEYKNLINQPDNESLIQAYMTDLIQQFRSAGAKGAHFFVMNEADLVGGIIRQMRQIIDNEAQCSS